MTTYFDKVFGELYSAFAEKLYTLRADGVITEQTKNDLEKDFVFMLNGYEKEIEAVEAVPFTQYHPYGSTAVKEVLAVEPHEVRGLMEESIYPVNGTEEEKGMFVMGQGFRFMWGDVA